MRGKCGAPAPGEPRRKRADLGASLATRHGPVWHHTLVRGSAEAQRPHLLSRLQACLPSLWSHNFAPPEAPSLRQPGGHTRGAIYFYAPVLGNSHLNGMSVLLGHSPEFGFRSRIR
ncbi:hypothetical protein NDU88_003366 [Pleurodeles waltl]|uniref:Uncharacterized protein n=1 Tax=Pleurodeles waltl TaxID=8319 RepID=A0AAV7KUR5_PLEWA|nr:hypothetical protein NDU88_003366 [Pleurodeles waltl]